MILLSVVLSDIQFEAVMKALLNAHHDLSFHHGLHVTDVDDVKTSFDIDCIETVNLIEGAMSDLDKSKRGIKLSKEEEETLKNQLLNFCVRVSSSKASCSQEILILPDILKILLACVSI